MEASKLNLGDIPEDFSLQDQDKNDWKLSDQKGKRVLLSFHPLAWTPVCADQMRCLERDMDVFYGLNTVPVGISVDSVPSKAAWANDLGLERLRILSDFWPHGKVAADMGLFRRKEGFSERANVLLNEHGVVLFVKTYPLSKVPDLKEIVDFIKELHASDVEGNVPAKQCMVDLQGKALCVEDSKNTGIQSTSDRHLE
jgi:peroxiredoxin